MTSPFRQSIAMLALITAGEAVFFLPFVIARVFRPTMLDVFQINNLELGLAFSVYGVVAMIAYFPGGPIADRFSARKMMCAALLATAVGGLLMASIPTLGQLKWLYGFWGVTTILLFWAPLIRATRQWGGSDLPGRAFGFLDGGRGLVAAAIGSVCVAVFASVMPDDVDAASYQQRRDAFRIVIWVFSGVTAAAAVLVWYGLRDGNASANPPSTRFEKGGIGRVLRMPAVWLQATVVLCAYVGYKGLDDISLYAHDALGFDEVKSAMAGNLSMWVRPPAAIIAGVVADRFGVAKMTMASFVLLATGSMTIATGMLQPGMVFAFFAIVTGTSAAVFALRGLYFAIMEEGRVPVGDTGTAVGIVSVVGYTPDVFMGPLMGVLLDRSPGALGHQHLFLVLAAFSAAGLIASAWFWRLMRRGVAAASAR